MNVESLRTNRTRYRFIGWHTVAVLSLSIAVLSMVSPQIGQLGRGLWTTLPALVLSWFGIIQVSPHAFRRSFYRFRIVFLLGFLFLTQAALRFIYADDSHDLWVTFFMGPLLTLVLLLWVGAYAELGKDTVRQLRRWVLFGWCASLALGLPVLIAHPEVARLTMGNKLAVENAATWAPYGVGEYSVYTSLSICLSPLFFVALDLRGTIRWLAIILVLLAATAVVFSTFTMASILAALGLIGTLVVWASAGRGWSRMWRAMIVLFPLALLILLYSSASLLPQTELVVSKAERLYGGISTYGLRNGEETGRGEMFERDIRVFSEEPFLGYIPHVTGQRDSGHSSLANSLVLFGIFCTALWVGALWSIFKRSLNDSGNSIAKGSLLISWLALFLGGILNPIWHSPMALGAMFVLTVPVRKNPMEKTIQGRTLRRYIGHRRNEHG